MARSPPGRETLTAVRDWREYAACATTSARWWDPGADRHDRARARRVCARCPVAQPCLNYGLTHEGWGIWGGVHLRDGTRGGP